jgi:hypothetical protein
VSLESELSSRQEVEATLFMIFEGTKFSGKKNEISSRSFTLARYADSNQGCQLVYFQNKNPILCKIWRALEWKMLVYFMVN